MIFSILWAVLVIAGGMFMEAVGVSHPGFFVLYGHCAGLLCAGLWIVRWRPGAGEGA